MNQAENKLWTPRVIQGDLAQNYKTPEPPDNEPWLSRIEVGTIFLTRNIKDPIVCAEWVKVNTLPGLSRIAHPAKTDEAIWVVDEAFCKINVKKAILSHE